LARKERRDCRIVLEANSTDNEYNFPVEKIVRVVRNDKGDAQSILVVTKNLTRQRAIEDELRSHRDHLEELVSYRTRELEASNKELESYSYSIAHDLRSPLRSITGFSQIIMEDYGHQFDEHGKNDLQRVIDSGKQMSEIIDDILELSRVNRVDFEKSAVNLTAISEQCIRQLQENIPRPEIQVSVAPGLAAQGDQKLIQIMLMNLIGNAWKYTSKNAHTEIEIGKEKRGAEAVFFVKDNGVGFDMAHTGKLFGVFQRMHKPGEFEGTGIGLATVQRIVARHGGRVWAEAAPNKGATFFFTLK
jgi:light-regulated signal transduction histidine kinase (bacteriophytochrome)